MNRRLVILGGGNMGLAIAVSLLQKNIFPLEKFLFVEPNPKRRIFLSEEHQFQTLSTLEELLSHDVILLAVKPQIADLVLSSLQGKVNANHLLISIMAGISMKRLRQVGGSTPCIRVMPNTPASIGKGASAYFGDESTTAESFALCRRIFSAIGQVVQVDSEEELNAVTAISGSGPAYVFYLAESMKHAAMKLGLSEEKAEILVTQTLVGSAELLNQSSQDAKTLRQNVTSPRGTTQAACEYFDAMDFSSIIAEGCRRAYIRADELSQL